MALYPFDPALILEDGSDAFTATGYGVNAGVPAVYDTGAGPALWTGFLAPQVSAVDFSNGDETYYLVVEGTNDATFASGWVELVAGPVTAIGFDPVAFDNDSGGTLYRFLRLKVVVGGTSPSITLFAWLASQLAGEQMTYSELVYEFGLLMDRLEEIADSGSYGESETTYNLKDYDVRLDNVAGQKAAIEAVVDMALSDYTDLIGRKIIGVGKVSVDETINLRNANIDLHTLIFTGAFGFADVMLRCGDRTTTPNIRLALPNEQKLVAWGGNPTSGIRAGLTCFHLINDPAPGARYDLQGYYAERGLLIDGNVEKKPIYFKGGYLDLAVEINHVPEGSPDTITVVLDLTNYSAIGKIPYTTMVGGGADVSVCYEGWAEGHVAKSDDRSCFTDSNGKATTYDMIIRTYNGQGLNGFYYFNQEQNDYTDSIFFGGRNRHIHMYGIIANFESVRRIAGTFNVREAFNGRMWTGSAATGADRQCPCVILGRIIDAGEFHLNLVAINNYRGVVYGTDTFYSIGCDFGSAHVSMGAFKPYNNEYPLPTRDGSGVITNLWCALEFYKAYNCTFTYSQVHGQVVIRSGIQYCTIRIPCTWVRIGYEMYVDPGAHFTIGIYGMLDLAEILSAQWLSQITGEQTVVFESVSDFGGRALYLRGGKWELGGSHTATTLSLTAQSSNMNLLFYKPGLPVGVSSGTWEDHMFVGTRAAPGWREVTGAVTIAPAELTQTAAAIARAGVAMGAGYRAALDRFYTLLGEIDSFPAFIAAYLPCLDTEAFGLTSLFPANGGSTYYDLTKSGNPLWTAKQGFRMNPTTVDQLLTTYDMTVNAEGAGLNDFLMVMMNNRDNPDYGGSDNVFDWTSLNGKAKLRNRDNAEQGSMGTTATTAFPQGTSRMPDVVMFGRVSAGIQFGVSGGRIVTQAAVPSSGGAGGMPDQMYMAGSREIAGAALLRASHFFELVGGVVKPKGDLPLVLHRAFLGVLQTVKKL